ncbi:hypothetical protein BDV06DRAFT_25944 [Aspergillus oleicola]
MSGLNPFRPKNLEAHQPQPRSAPSPSSPVPALDPIFSESSNQPHVRLPSASESRSPPSRTNAPDLDGPAALDKQSTSDPFSQGSDVSDDGLEHVQLPSVAPTTASLSDRPLPSSVFSSQLATTKYSDGRRIPTTDNPSYPKKIGKLSEDTKIADSFVPNQSASLEETNSEDSTDEHHHAGATKAGRPIPLGPGIDPGALAIRSGNRERVPPPPPKSHHGRLIGPNLSITSRGSQMISNKTANRVSIHGSSPRALVSPSISQTSSDYFDISKNQSASSTDALRRSQSQHKRPPTPPLSRRHSQMRRSKSTLSKPSSSHLSSQHSIMEAGASTLSSAASRSLAPSLREREVNNDTSILDQMRPNSTLQSENLEPTSSQLTETPGLEIHSNSRAYPKQVSITNNLPPPPPPRRTRGRIQGSDDNRDQDFRSEQRADGSENFVLQPSNAKDILADLSRLQKEVDDLRGHYENRKAQ